MAKFKLIPAAAQMKRYQLGKLEQQLKSAGLAEYAVYCNPNIGPLAVLPDLADPGQPGASVGALSASWRLLVVNALQYLRKHFFNEGAPGLGSMFGGHFNEYDSKVVGSEFQFRKIWARRIAMAMYVDKYESAPWSLASYPDWQLHVLLGWNPFLGSASSDGPKLFRDAAFTPFDNGHDFWRDPKNPGSYTMRFVWEPNPLHFYYEAKRIFDLYSPETALDFANAIVTDMRSLGFFHGHEKWYWPSKGIYPFKVGSAAVKNESSVDCTATQLINGRMGGCWINSRYIQKVLRSFNVPAVASVRRGYLPDTEDMTINGRVARVYTGTGAKSDDHYGVVAYGADASILHGDDAIGHAEFYRGWTWSSANADLTWRPARTLYYLEQAASEVDFSDYRKEIEQAVDTANAWMGPLLQPLSWKAALDDLGVMPTSWWKDLGLQLFAMLAWRPGPKCGPIKGYTTHFGWKGLPSPYTPSFLLRPRQVLTKGFAVACTQFKDYDLVENGEALSATWALNTFVYYCLRYTFPGDPTIAAMYDAYVDRFFRMEVTEHEAGPDGVEYAYHLAFPGELTLDASGKPSSDSFGESLDRVLFPASYASLPSPIVNSGSLWDASLLRVGDRPEARQAIATFAAEALIWFLIDRDPGYFPGSTMPKGYSVFAMLPP